MLMHLPLMPHRIPPAPPMSRKSTWRKQQAELRELEIGWFNAGRKTGEQFTFDLLLLALSDPDVMGSQTPSKKRLIRIHDALGQLQEKWGYAMNLYKETDTMRTLLDQELEKILGDKFTPFYERYDYLRKTKEEMEIEHAEHAKEAAKRMR